MHLQSYQQPRKAGRQLDPFQRTGHRSFEKLLTQDLTARKKQSWKMKRMKDCLGCLPLGLTLWTCPSFVNPSPQEPGARICSLFWHALSVSASYSAPMGMFPIFPVLTLHSHSEAYSCPRISQVLFSPRCSLALIARLAFGQFLVVLHVFSCAPQIILGGRNSWLMLACNLPLPQSAHSSLSTVRMFFFNHMPGGKTCRAEVIAGAIRVSKRKVPPFFFSRLQMLP